MSCTNNLHQIGLSLHNYHSAYSRFPPAVVMPYAKPDVDGVANTATNPFGPNWAVYLLPHLEQENLYKQADLANYPGTKNLGNFAS
jgi:hypothetical protein